MTSVPIIDLRSDTVTKPTVGMRKAMAEAGVGDDVLGEDPTVIALQERVAALLGKEAALFVPSGTMANQIALKVHCEPGDDVIIGQNAHNYYYESGAAGAIAGVQFTIVGQDGAFTGADVRAAFKLSPINHLAPTRLVCVENTHNRAGGFAWPQSQLDDVTQTAKDLGLALHLDGARILNAALATRTSAAVLARQFDTASICFSKGLGAPVGSALAGSRTAMHRAHRFRKMLGGGMRQAGILAAAAIYALDHHVERLAEDHANAKALASGLAGIRGLHVDVDRVMTNIVLADLDAGLPDAMAVAERLRAAGVLVLPVAARRLRLLTHLDVSSDDCKAAVQRIARVLEA